MTVDRYYLVVESDDPDDSYITDTKPSALTISEAYAVFIIDSDVRPAISLLNERSGEDGDEVPFRSE